MYVPMVPSAATRPAFLPAEAMPFLRSHSCKHASRHIPVMDHMQMTLGEPDRLTGVQVTKNALLTMYHIMGNVPGLLMKQLQYEQA